MFYKLKRYISGMNRISIEGLNLDRALATLLNKGIVIEDMRRPTHRVIECAVTDKMLKKLIVSLDPLCYNITVVHNYGLKKGVSTLKKRLGLAIGLAVIVTGVAVYNTFLWDVRIEGTETVKNKQVMGLLKESGIAVGVRKGSFDRNIAADMLNSKLGEASLVTIELKGTTAIIHIKERIMPPVPPDTGDYGNDMVSAEDCIVESVTSLSGTPIVKAGEIVKRGEVLIAGFAERYEGSTLVRDTVKADGVVWGEVSYTELRYFPIERVEYARTGNYKDITVATAFGKSFGKTDYKPDYAFFETVTQPPVAMYMIPVRLTVTRYYEVAARLVVLNEDEVVPMYKRDLLDSAMLKVPATATFKSSYITVTRIDNAIRIDAVIKTRQIISTRIAK